MYVVYRLRVDWSFTGTLIPNREDLAECAASSIIWVGTETLSVRSYEVTAAVLAVLLVGLYKMALTMWAVDKTMSRDPSSELFDQ